MKIKEINKEQANILKDYFIADNLSFDFEGCWLRNQRVENAKRDGKCTGNNLSPLHLKNRRVVPAGFLSKRQCRGRGGRCGP